MVFFVFFFFLGGGGRGRGRLLYLMYTYTLTVSPRDRCLAERVPAIFHEMHIAAQCDGDWFLNVPAACLSQENLLRQQCLLPR